MDILILDQGSAAGGLALKAAALGHKVHWYIEPKDTNNQKTGHGLHDNIKRVTEWVSIAKNMDLIMTTENGSLLQPLERFRKLGIPVYAPSQQCADLEIKRETGLKFFEKYKLPVPDYKTFGSLAEAKKFIYENPEAWVFKTMGDNEDKSLSFVSKSPEQMIQQIDMWEKQKLNPKGKVMLQQKIDGICEMSVSSFLGSDGFNGPFIHCWEHKKLMNGEKGPNTGEMGSLLLASNKSKLAKEVLIPLEEALTDMNAFCNFDVNCMIDKKGQPWILEATARFGWPSTNIEIEMFKGDMFEQIVDACNGEDSIKMTKDWTIGVVLAIPDFPYTAYTKDQVSNIPVYGVSDKNMKHIHPLEVTMGTHLDEDLDEVDGWMTTGNYTGVVTATGETIEAAREAVYKTVDELSVSNLIYRTDIGEKVQKVLPELVEHGLINKPLEEE